MARNVPALSFDDPVSAQRMRTSAGMSVLLTFLFSSAGASPVNLAEAVTIGGIRQWITVKGARNSDPIILFLHGGPGNSAMRYADEFTDSLQQHFLVVQWDQRETGRTKELNDSPGSLTVARFESDAVELIRYLETRFSKSKIILMGHSWGGFLALWVAARHPELLTACFAISPMVWQVESERHGLSQMKAQAIAEGNKQELAELSEVTIPFANGRQLYYHRKWLAVLMGQKSFSGSFVGNWATRWLPVFNEASQINLFSEAPEYKCPVFFLVGDRDLQTWFKLTDDYYKMVTAPRKAIFWFENSAHSFLSSERKKLQEIIQQQSLTNPSN